MSIEPDSAVPAKEDPETLALRAKPRKAVRFRRGLIVGIAATVAVCLTTASWMALEPPSQRKAAVEGEVDEASNAGLSDALAAAPKSYGDVPRLGPPLPGDLGRPILEQERSMQQGSASGSEPISQGSKEPDRSLGHEASGSAAMAARSAGLMFQLGSADPRPDMNSEQGSTGDPLRSNPAKLQAEPSAPEVSASQKEMLDFARAETGTQIRHSLIPAPASPSLSAGTLISASLVTGLNSDLPGMVVAQVTENVRDSATGHYVLIPQGSRLIGSYDSLVAYGQRRALLIWNRIVLPDGSSVELDHMPATDASGYSGVSDGVDSHTWQLLKGIGMATLLGIGTQLSFGGSGSDLVRAIRESAQENAAHAGDQITSRNLSIQPTVTVRPGWPIRALVNKDLELPPWRG